MESITTTFSGVECCFCKQDISSTHIDPCGINIMGHWDRDSKERSSMDFFCHFDCLRKYLHENCSESRINEISKSEFICCFCNKIIKQTDVNPCNINIMGNYKKLYKHKLAQDYCMHIECIRNIVHEYYKGYLIDEIFSISDNESIECEKHSPCNSIDCFSPTKTADPINKK